MKRTAFRLAAVIILLSMLLSGCQFPAPSTPTAVLATAAPAPTQPSEPPTPAPVSGPAVVISEMMAGLPEDNTAQFIELYNRSGQPLDLKGYSLWYRIPTSQKDLLVYQWRNNALVPPFGHYLLAREGLTAKLPGAPTADAEFSQPISPFDGGLLLRDADRQPADALGWGKAPDGFYEKQPAASIERGAALERKPGGTQGSSSDQNDNLKDFSGSTAPDPQNTGSASTPERVARLNLSITAPGAVAPGGSFDYVLRVTNQTGFSLDSVDVRLPLPEGVRLLGQQGISQPQIDSDNVIEARLSDLNVGEERSFSVSVQAPYLYSALRLINAYAQPVGRPDLVGFNGPLLTQVEGGQVNIGAARGMTGAELTVEGIATSYTGGFFAGDGNVKFYLQDRTGAIQVQVFGGQGQVNVQPGDRVRVRGQISEFRGAVQILPVSGPEDVEITRAEAGASQPEPQVASLSEALATLNQPPSTTLAGRLVQVQGEISRVEEFNYSYEIDLTGGSDRLTVYVDKQTGIEVQPLESGQTLSVTGIVELRDGKVELYPRRQADVQPVFPPVADVTVDAPVSVALSQPFTVTLTATNHNVNAVPRPLVALPIPAHIEIVKILDGGAIFPADFKTGEVKRIQWSLNDLPANGGSQSVSLVLRAHYGTPVIELSGYYLTAPSMIAPVTGAVRLVYAKGVVPIGALQGPGDRSPVTGSPAVIKGIVTGVFADLGGFFVQGEPDDNRDTSDAIFVEAADAKVKQGDSVEVSGVVREAGQQTQLQADPGGVRVVSQGASLPKPVELDPPASPSEARLYYERLEGMYVSAQRVVAVGPSTLYGEFVVVRSDLGVSRLYQGQPERNGVAIVVDDGANIQYEDGSQLPYRVQTGDLIGGLRGPLAYTYDQYKVEPVAALEITSTAVDAPRIRAAGDDQLSLMTWNTENLFDSAPPNPADPPMPSLSQYMLSLKKVAATIAAAGAPDIIGLQEVENVQVLEDIAAQAALKDYHYAAYLEEGSDSRGIDVGFLIRSDRLEVLSVRQYAESAGVFSRPPLLVRARALSSGLEVYAVVNHFTSMNGGEQASEPRRLLQAQGNVKIVEEILEENPQATVAVLGDLNSYYASAPIDALRAGGLRHVFEKLGADERYTYVYQGQSQVLDHILVTGPLFERIERVEALRVNSDFPPSLPNDDSPFGKSDHDPVVVVFNFQ